jgi:hypothetical protein
MSPDFGYYLRRFEIASVAHGFIGTLTVCLPSGMVALTLFYLWRKPLCYLLPEPHRSPLTALTEKPPILRPSTIFSACASVLIGAWTHVVWDSFTHKGGWTAQRVPALEMQLFQIGHAPIVLCYALQQLSTFGGGALLASAYIRWLRRQPPEKPNRIEAFTDRQRYLLLAALSFVALVVAIPPAWSMARALTGFEAFRVFVFRTGVYATALGLPLFTIASLALYTAQHGSQSNGT